MPKVLQVLALVALIVGTNPVLSWGWGTLGRQEGFTPITLDP